MVVGRIIALGNNKIAVKTYMYLHLRLCLTTYKYCGKDYLLEKCKVAFLVGVMNEKSLNFRCILHFGANQLHTKMYCS